MTFDAFPQIVADVIEVELFLRLHDAAGNIGFLHEHDRKALAHHVAEPPVRLADAQRQRGTAVCQLSDGTGQAGVPGDGPVGKQDAPYSFLTSSEPPRNTGADARPLQPSDVWTPEQPHESSSSIRQPSR